MAEKEVEKINKPTETNPRQESVENSTERERVKTLLQDFYQERQKNMPVHREIGELTEKMRALLEKILPYFDKFHNSKNTIDEEYFKSGEPDLPIRKELSFSRINKDGNKEYMAGQVISPNLRDILDKGFIKKPESRERQEIEELIKNFEDVKNKLNEKIRELWEIRKKIAKELILTIPEFQNWKDAEFEFSAQNEDLYNLGSFIKAEKKFETEGGKKEKSLYFELAEYSDGKEIIKELTKMHKITEEELKEIKELKWSGEEKEKLKKFAGKVDKYKLEAEAVKKQFLEIEETFEFDEHDAGLIEYAMTRAFVKRQYTNSGLPKIHKERVVQQIMNGTFKF